MAEPSARPPTSLSAIRPPLPPWWRGVLLALWLSLAAAVALGITRFAYGLLLPPMRADLTIAETHRYVDGPPLDCPITAFGGQDDERASRDDLAAWAAHTSDRFAVQIFPGDHFFLQQTTAALVKEAAI